MSEEQKMTSGQQTEQAAAQTDIMGAETPPSGKKKNTQKWIIAAVVAVLAAVVVGVIVYTNSPSYQAHRALSLGERYIDELDYEQAIAEFQRALDLMPNNAEIEAAIRAHLEDFLTLAEGYGESGDYEAERRLANCVLTLDSDNERAKALLTDADILELISLADQSFEAGEYEDAKEKYDEALDKGAEEEDVNPRRPLCDIYLKLMELCAAEDWLGVAEYMDSADFDAIMEALEMGNPQFASGSVQLMIGEKDGSVYVVAGDLTEDNASGNGVAVISSANTYAVYDGGWANYVPEGNGTLRIWNKNEDMASGNLYSGSFAGGVLDGAAVLNVLVDGTAQNLDITVSAGKVSIFKTDEEGYVWLYDLMDNGTYAVDGVTEDNGTIAGYAAGVPGFGGSDMRLSVFWMAYDKEPPVLTCSLSQGRWYNGSNYELKGITAIDDIDGDLTSAITSTKTSTSYSKVVIVYSATDAAGNTGTLTVTYDIDHDCGYTYYKVASVQ